MTINEFLDELAALECIDWQLTEHGQIRGHTQDTGTYVCPITAVAYATTFTQFSIDQAWEAAKALGLDDAYTMEVIAAADNRMDNSPLTPLMRALLESALDIQG